MHEMHDPTELLWNDAQGQHVELDVPEPPDQWSLDDFNDLVRTGGIRMNTRHRQW